MSQTAPETADCACPTCSAAREPQLPQTRNIRAGAAKFVACADRGTHERLTDCWVCWSDVHQGHCALEEILHPDAWDLFAGTDHETRDRGPGLRLISGS